MIADAFVYPVNKGGQFPHPCFIIDMDKRILPALQSHLKRYVLRNKVSLSDVTDTYKVMQISGPTTKSLLDGNFIDKRLGDKIAPGSLVSMHRFCDVSLKDKRHEMMGMRIVHNIEKPVSLPSSFEQVSSVLYHAKRMALGIPEGTSSIINGTSLPLESNFDYMNGVDFRKGCYLGQELTIRTYHTGVIRKRVIPIQIFSSLDEALHQTEFEIDTEALSQALLTTNPSPSSMPISQSDITVYTLNDQPSQRTRGSPGKFCESISNIGLSMLKLDHASLEGEYVLANSGKVLKLENGMFARAFVPYWWPTAPPFPNN